MHVGSDEDRAHETIDAFGDTDVGVLEKCVRRGQRLVERYDRKRDAEDPDRCETPPEPPERLTWVLSESRRDIHGHVGVMNPVRAPSPFRLVHLDVSGPGKEVEDHDSSQGLEPQRPLEIRV